MINIDAIQTPFLGAGIMTNHEIKHLCKNSENARIKTLKFIKQVLHKGDKAIRIFLIALKNSFGKTGLYKLLTTANVDDRLKGKCIMLKKPSDLPNFSY